MKKLYRGILAACILSFITLIPLNTTATHLMGSDLTWTDLGNDSFLVKLTIYRDCNGISLRPATIEFRCASTSNLITSSSIAVPTPVDITPISNGSSNCNGYSPLPPTRCSNPNSAFPFGVEKYVYTAIVVLSAAGNCCEIDVSYYACCRNSTITTGLADKGFYAGATLNRCIPDGNNSPEFTNIPVSIICVGQDFSFNHGVVDTDVDSSGGLSDSLVYEWAPPKGKNASNLSYSGQYNYDKPIFFWGFPNTNLTEPRGLHLSSTTGDIAFRPMKIEQTVMTIKVSEYRNGVKIGEIRRDLQIIVISCPNNNPPILGGPFYKEVCATSTVCFSIATNDYDVDDTLKISWSGTIPGAIWTDNNCLVKHPTGTLCWTPGEDLASPYPYVFTVTVEDDGYPVRGKSTKAYQIVVKPLPKATLSVTDSNCGDYYFSASPLIGNNPGFLWLGNYNPGFTHNGSSFHHKFNDPGEYPFTMTVTADGCERTYFDTVVVDTFISIVDIADQEVCFGDTVSLQALCQNNQGPVSYLWSTSETSSGILLYANKDSFLTITVTDSTNCTASDQVEINVHRLPEIQLQDKNFICENGFDYLIPQISFDESRQSQLSWYDVNDPSFISHDNVLYVDEDGQYICEVEDTLGCIGYDTVEIIQNPKLTAYADDQEICYGEDVVLEALSTGSLTNNVHYKWYNAGQLIGDQKQITHHPLVTTTYKLHVSENLNGIYCEDSCEVTVTVNPLPQIVMDPIDSRCVSGANSQSIELSNYVTVSPINSIVSWQSNSPGFTKSLSGDKFIPGLAQAGEHWIFITATDLYSKCSVRDSATVIIHALPKVDAGPDDEICSADGLYELDGQPVGSGGIWSSMSRSLVNQVNSKWYFNPEVIGNNMEKDYYLFYTYTDEYGCENQDTMELTVYKTPEPEIVDQPDVCVDAENFVLKAFPLGGRWSGSGVLQDSFCPKTAGEGQHMIEYKVENKICSAKDQTIITVNPLPQIDVATRPNKLEFCATEGFVELIGIPEGGTWTGPGVSGNYFNTAAKDLGNGYFELVYTYKDKNGCENNKSLTLFVKPTPSLYIEDKNKTLCYPDSISVMLNFEHAQGIEWFTKPDLASGYFAGDIQSKTVLYRPDMEDVLRGYFYLFAKTTHTDDICEPACDSIRIQISDYPLVDFSSDNTEGCEPLNVNFEDLSVSSQGNIVEWHWTIDDLTYSSEQFPEYEFREPGEYSIKLKVVNQMGCASEIEKSSFIKVFANPEASFIPSPAYVEITDPVVQFENTTTNSTNRVYYEWNFGDPLSGSANASTLTNPEHSYTDTGLFSISLIARNEHHCVDTAENFVEILPVAIVYTPTAFTPDNQGPEQNDIFKVTVLYADEFDLKIYSRWGQLVYESYDYESHGWDGTYLYSEKKVPMDAYVYVLQVGNKAGKNYAYTGTITLLK
jgi:PKD repeat protein